MNKSENPTEFVPFPKLSRLSRECIITEKLDGTNAQILIEPGYNYNPTFNLCPGDTARDGIAVLAGSRNRWLTVESDNYGFARWVSENRHELVKLGPGRHFGEWWGNEIQRGYGLTEKRFSLFNVTRWCKFGEVPQRLNGDNPAATPKFQDVLPDCVGLVPVLFRGMFEQENWETALYELEKFGSKAAPGYNNPEGIVVYHTAAGICFKKTLNNDDKPKAAI